MERIHITALAKQKIQLFTVVTVNYSTCLVHLSLFLSCINEFFEMGRKLFLSVEKLRMHMYTDTVC